MIFVWDETKRLANLAKHKLDFADKENGFNFADAIALPAKPSTTGRNRLRLIGELNGALLVAIIASPLGAEAVSIVSLRPANKRESQLHES